MPQRAKMIVSRDSTESHITRGLDILASPTNGSPCCNQQQGWKPITLGINAKTIDT